MNAVPILVDVENPMLRISCSPRLPDLSPPKMALVEVLEKPFERFWLVWSPQGEAPPRWRHTDERHAIAEAKRLARLHPTQEFFVVEAKSRARSVVIDVHEAAR